MGVAVQFPDDFRIAAAQGIERMQLAPMQERGAFAGDRIEAPVNRRIGQVAETQADVAEQENIPARAASAILMMSSRSSESDSSSPRQSLFAVRARAGSVYSSPADSSAPRVAAHSPRQTGLNSPKKLVVLISSRAAQQAVAKFSESLA